MQNNIYKLIIKDLKINACHGVKEFEKYVPQQFVVSAIVYSIFPFHDAREDKFHYINCYGNIRNVILQTFLENSFKTLESIAY